MVQVQVALNVENLENLAGRYCDVVKIVTA